MVEVLLIIFTTIIDKLRGQGKLPKSIMQMLYGVGLAAYLNYNLKFIIAFSIAFVLGISIGWGEPVGAYIQDRPMQQDKLESWQFGLFRKNVFAAICLRALIWVMPLIIICIWWPQTMPAIPAIFISFILAVKIAKRMLKNTIAAWEYHELIRGFLVGSLTVLFSKLITF